MNELLAAVRFYNIQLMHVHVHVQYIVDRLTTKEENGKQSRKIIY